MALSYGGEEAWVFQDDAPCFQLLWKSDDTVREYWNTTAVKASNVKSTFPLFNRE